MKILIKEKLVTKEIDKLAWLHIHQGKLLVARSKDKELFYIPGGKREQNESDEQALIREIKEEISVDLISKSIKYAGTFTAPADSKAENVNVKLTCYFAEYQGTLTPNAEIEQIDFVSYENRLLCSKASVAIINELYKNNLLV